MIHPRERISKLAAAPEAVEIREDGERGREREREIERERERERERDSHCGR